MVFSPSTDADAAAGRDIARRKLVGVRSGGIVGPAEDAEDLVAIRLLSSDVQKEVGWPTEGGERTVYSEGGMTNSGEYLYRIRATRPEMVSKGPTDGEAAILKQHVSYLEQLAARGVLILAGRTQNPDPSGFGLVIFRASSTAQAREIMLADLAVKHGLMAAELFPYSVAVPGTLSADGP